MKETERVKRLKKNFLVEFVDRGKSIPEIGEEYGVSTRHIYSILPQIAALHHVDVEIFYQKEHGMHVVVGVDGRIRPNRVSFEEILKKLDESEALLGNLSDSFLSLQKELENNVNAMEEMK